MFINIKKRIFILLSCLATLGNIAARDSIVIEQDSILPIQYKDSIAVDTGLQSKSRLTAMRSIITFLMSA